MTKYKTTINVDAEVKLYLQDKQNVSKFVNDLIKDYMSNNDEVFQMTKIQQRNKILERISQILKEEIK